MGITSIALLPPRCLELVWCWLPWSSVLLRQVMDMEDLDKPISFREVSQEQSLVSTSKSTCSQCTSLHMFLFTMSNMLHLFSMCLLHQIPDITMPQLLLSMPQL